MEHSKLISSTDTLDNVIKKIKANNTTSYQWYSVKGKNGCLFELGGRNIKGTLELKADIPRIEDGKYMVH